MNMQNIPSHATDIRHLFRATTQKEETFESHKGEAETIHFKLPSYYLVKLVDGSTKDASEIVPNEMIEVTDESNNIVSLVIENVINHLDTTTLIAKEITV